MNVEEETPKYDRKKRKKSNIAYIIIFVCFVALLLTLVLSFGDLTKMAGAFTEMVSGENVIYLVVAIILAIVFFILYPIPLMLVGRRSGLKSGRMDLWLTGNCEHFYNGVTPSSSGGQPFQAYALYQSGDTGASATGVILMNYINIVLCSNIFGFVSLIFYPKYVQGLANIEGLEMDLSSLQWIAVLGIILNAANLVLFCVLGFSKTARRAIMWAFKLVLKPKFLNKRFGKFIPAFDRYLENAQSTAKVVLSHWKTFILAVITRMLVLTILYSIPFFLMMAMPSLDIHPSDYWLCMLGNSFATVCVAWVPTPGAVGAGEIVGAVVLGSITVKSGTSLDFQVAQALSLLNRGISFYFVLILSFVTSLIFEIRVSKRIKAKALEEESAPKENEENKEDDK
ncbi:MAG: flippase-like domain-containing protein [Bacilli bacterium]|nr:flippase-like domain-containing protein [Bacilli bacterium]